MDKATGTAKVLGSLTGGPHPSWSLMLAQTSSVTKVTQEKEEERILNLNSRSESLSSKSERHTCRKISHFIDMTLWRIVRSMH
jgi:hypothetical protein